MKFPQPCPHPAILIFSFYFAFVITACDGSIVPPDTIINPGVAAVEIETPLTENSAELKEDDAVQPAYPEPERKAERPAYPDPSDPDAYPGAYPGPGSRPGGSGLIRKSTIDPPAGLKLRYLPIALRAPQPPLELLLTPVSDRGVAPAPSAEIPAGAASSECAGIVGSSGDRLVYQGQPFTFFGINAHFLLDKEFPEARMEPAVRDLSSRGVGVIRVWFFYDEDPERFSRLLDIGQRHGVRFIVTLTDNVFKGKDWFGGEEDKERFRPHLERTVGRFKDRPEILYWELANEPNCGESFGEECMDTIKDWLTGRSKTVKAIDACHLVSTGMISAGNYDFERDEYRRIHRRETIGVVSAHKRTDESREREREIADELDRPIVYGEIYDKAHGDDCQPLDGGREMRRRAGRVKDDLRSALRDGVDGYVLWAFAAGAVERSNGTTKYYCGSTDYELSDPVWQTLAEDSELLPPVPWRTP